MGSRKCELVFGMIHWVRLAGFLMIVSCAAPNISNEEDPGTPDLPLFTLLDSSLTGVGFVNVLEEREDWNILQYEYLFNGGGVAAGDINNDGLVDLYFVSNSGSDHLYLNKGGFKFDDVSTAAGIDEARGYKTGVAMADINGDGLLDIHVCRDALGDPELRRNLLYINNGDLTFTERAEQVGLDDPSYSTQAHFFDMDLDGDLDMYLINHPASMVEANNIKVMMSPSGKLEVVLPADLTYISDRLYRNDRGAFKDVTKSAGLLNEAFGLSALIDDFNGDGLPDIHVCNDYVKPDQLLISQGDGTFKDEYDAYFPHGSYSSMGSDMADINNDGLPDLMTLDMTARDHHRYHTLGMATNLDKYNKILSVGLGAQFPANTLQLNNGNGSFSDICFLSGMAFTDWSWSPLLADLDNDGWKDAWVSNGYVRDVTNDDYQRYEMSKLQQELTAGRLTIVEWLKSIPSVKVASFLFRNEGDLTFSDRSSQWNSGPPAFSNGSASVDLDNDGYLDIVTNNINDVAFVLRNNGAEQVGNNFVDLRLLPVKGHTAIGAKVVLRLDDGTQQLEQVRTARGFLSSSDATVHFGLGTSTKAEQVEITWPDGSFQVEHGLAINTKHDIKQLVNLPKAPHASGSQSVFVDRSSTLPVELAHAENVYDDFKREPLLYHKLSQTGPAVAIGDVDGNGTDDIYLGGAMNASGKLFLQNPPGSFIETSVSDFVNDRIHEDVSALLLDVDRDGDLDLFVGSGGNERPASDAAYVDRLYMNDGTGNFARAKDALPEARNSNSCVSAFDFDGDGDLDLFVGSRSVPAKYPVSPAQQLLRNDGGRFVDATDQWSKDLRFVGMITDAESADLDLDGSPELVLAGDWMPITVFSKRNGRLVNVTKELGLNEQLGWWCSVAIGDLDGDGYPEVIAGNRGLNSGLKASVEQPISLYYKDFDGNGSMDAVLCEVVNGKDSPVQLRDRLLDQMVMLKKRFLRYATYADATITDMFTPEELQQVGVLHANTFAHTLFWNKRKEGFVAQVLPNGAQLSMAQAVHITDADGDGNMDVIVAGNFYGTDTQFGRYDASIGSFQKGDGRGGLILQPATKIGTIASGNVRHLAPITVQGRPCLLVVRNNDQCGLTELLRPELQAAKE